MVLSRGFRHTRNLLLGLGFALVLAGLAGAAPHTQNIPIHKPGVTPPPNRILPLKPNRSPALKAQTTRPLEAVGTIKSIDAATSTVLIQIDRSRSSLPRVLEFNSRKLGVKQRILDQEFPPERIFLITPDTMLLDNRIDEKQVLASTGKIREDKQLLPFSAFKQGETVSILFRMTGDSNRGARALNLCKVDPNQQNFSADAVRFRRDPLGRRNAASTSTLPTTGSTAGAAPHPAR